MKILNFIVIFTVLLLSSIAHSQNSKWSIGAHASFDVGYRFFTKVDPDIQHVVDLNDRFDVPAFMYSAGLYAEWQFHEKLSLSFGVQYSTRGYGQEILNVQMQQGLNQPTWDWYTQIRHHFIGIPVKLKYDYFRNKKINLFFAVGANLDFLYLTSVNRKTVKDNGEIEKDYETDKWQKGYPFYNQFNPSASISFGIDIKVNSSRIRLEPNFQLALRPLVNNVPFGTYFYKGGLNVAYIYNF